MAPYGHLKVCQLKELLRERGASLKGKKKDLVERLKLYDENNNFRMARRETDKDKVQSVDNNLFLPLNDNFRDINASSELPPITVANIINFLNRFEIGVGRGEKMYQNQYLLNVRMAIESNIYYFTGQCKASMKKPIVYNITVHISFSGSIEASQCDCSVGEPPDAHCKHVIALLLGVEDMKREKKIILNISCTQKLQSFHRPVKNYFGSPLRADKLPIRKKEESLENMNYLPIHTSRLNAKKYREKIRNMAVNYIGHYHSTMPFKHIIHPANIYGVVNDHNYVVDKEKEILQSLLHSNVSDDLINDIEKLTQGQANDTKWHEIRRNHITSTNFHACCKAVSEQAKHNLVQRILSPVEFKSKQTQHGKDCEQKAIQVFELHMNTTVQKCGIFLYKNKPFLGASPDGLLGQEIIIEVKCPFNQRNYPVNDITIPYLWKNDQGNLYLEQAHPYYYQIQGQLMVTGRKYAKLLVYTFVECAVVHVPRDDVFICEMEKKLTSFYEDYFRSAILEKHLYKNYAKCFYK